MKRTTPALAVAAVTLFAGMLMTGVASATEVLCDPGFEGSAACWVPGNSPGAQQITGNTGMRMAQYCGYSDCQGSYSQSFTVPANVTQATLSFWYYTPDYYSPPPTQPPTTIVCGGGYVMWGVNDGSAEDSHNVCYEDEEQLRWNLVTMDLTAFLQAREGADVTVFTLGDSGASTTRWYVDEISLDVTIGPPDPYFLGVSKSGFGTGTVTSSPTGIDCGWACTGSYVPGTTVTLTATPAKGARFIGWSGGGECHGTAGTCTVTMDQNRSAQALFDAPLPLRISLNLRRHLFATGRIFSGDVSGRPCWSNVPVRLQKRRSGGWVTVGTTSTDGDGYYGVRLRDSLGRYRAVTPASEGDYVSCRAARSAEQVHGH